MALQRRMRVLDDSGSDSKESDVSIKVGFASGDMEHVDQHFGSAKNLVIYAVLPDDSWIVEVAGFDYINHDDNEGKLGEKINFLEGCVAVYSQAVGSSAAQKLLAAGIQPVKVHEQVEIAKMVKYLQEEMMQGPSTWLAKAINQQKNPDPARFKNMELEGWDE